jgi:hypothetical protein
MRGCSGNSSRIFQLGNHGKDEFSANAGWESFGCSMF